jgi:predicted porin
MNKKLIASAMGLVMAGGMGLANADVKLYGKLDLSLLATDSDAPGYQDDINMKSTNSAIGVKGTEDLGNGLSAFFKMEYEADMANGGDFGKGRDQYLGLKMEQFGKLTFGTTSTAYKSGASKIDAFWRTPLEGRQIGLASRLHAGKGEEGEGRGTNMIRYDSVKMGGLGLTATYQFDSSKGDGEDDDPYSVGLSYKGGGLFAHVAYIDTQQTGDTAAAEAIVKYNLNDAIEFHGIYELDKGLITNYANNGFLGYGGAKTGTSQDDGANIWSVGATYMIGNNLIGADYGQRDNSNGADGIAGTADDIESLDAWRLAAYHSFSKRTRVYLGYASTDYDKKGTDTRWALGMRHSF